MLNKYSVLALIGATSATVTPTPLPGSLTAYPKYNTPTAATSTEFTANNYVINFTYTLASGSTTTAGPLRGFRANLAVFPTQTITKPATQTTNTDAASIASAASGTRTFYQTVSTELGTFPTALVNTGADATAQGTAANNSHANGATWVLCDPTAANVADATKCNGGPYYNHSLSTPSNKSKTIPNRIVLQALQTSAISAGESANPNIQGDIDIWVASFYHASWGATEVTTGASWCSAWINILPKGQTAVSFSATNGFTGRSKCTWQLRGEDGTVGITFKLASAAYVKFILNYIEWNSAAGLGSNYALPVADGGVYKIGAYPVATSTTTAGGEVWLNPALSGAETSGTWLNSAIAWNRRTTDPTTLTPGSIGNAIFYPGLDGMNKETQTIQFDMYLATAILNQKRNEINSFNTVANDYNSKRTTYDNAVTAENTRRGDLLKSTFEPAVALPSRPCPPTPPAPFNLFNIELAAFVAASNPTAAYANHAAAKENATLANIVGSAQTNPASTFHTRSGFLRISADSSIATPDIANAGHVQGTFGQGNAAMPDAVAPFQWALPAATNIPGTMITILPEADSETGLNAAANKIIFTGMGKQWQDLSSFSRPTPPGAPANPKNPPGSSGVKLAAGFVAAATVLASLY